MKKIIVFGGTGFLGSRFEKKWKNKYEIISLGSKGLKSFDYEVIYSFLKKENPDYVINMMGLTNQQYCINNPEIAHKINVEAALNIAKASKEINSELIFLSTEQVFNGSKEKAPYTEESETVPDTIYGCNKKEVENCIFELNERCWVLRLTWLFGLPETGCRMNAEILWSTIDSLIKNKTIAVSKHEYRGMTYVNDVVNNLPEVFNLPYGLYNFGSETKSSRYEIVKYIMQELGVSEDRIKEMLMDNNKYTIEKPRDLRLDNKKITDNGIVFDETKEAIHRCLKEYNFIC